MSSKSVFYLREKIHWVRLEKVTTETSEGVTVIVLGWDSPDDNGQIELEFGHGSEQWSMSGDCDNKAFLMSVFASIADEVYGETEEFEDDSDDDDDSSEDDDDDDTP